MTVTTTTRTAGPFLGNGATSVYAFAFKVFLTTDVLVQLTSAGGVLSTGVLGTDYSVSLNADQNANPGGNVILTAPLASGASLTIGSQVPLTQGVVLTNPGNWYPQVVSDALDKVTILIQQALTSIGGALRIPEIGSSATILPVAALRANKLLSFDSVGNPTTVAPALGTATALAIALAASGGATQVGTISDATGGVYRTLMDRLLDTKSAFDFMSVAQIADVRAGTHLVDVTVALQAAIDWCAPRGIAIYMPAGTYSVLPGTASVGAGTFNTALVLRSGLKFVGNPSTVIRIADSYSTDGSPKEFSTFANTAAPISGVTFDAVTFDQNGANNTLSPLRPVTYGTFNHFAVVGNGDTGQINNLKFINCTFQNCAGECYVSQLFVQNNHAVALPSGMQMLNCRFLNGGLDVKDHSCVYSWGTDCLFDGCFFTSPTPPWTTGLTGVKTCIEVHGSNQVVTNCSNTLNSSSNGLYIAPNFTSVTTGVVVNNCKWQCTDYNILIWRAVGALAYAGLDGVAIFGNYFSLNDYQHTSPPAYKAMIAYQGELGTVQGGVKNVRIFGNQYASTSTTLTTSFVKWDMTGQAGEDCVGISITDNEGFGTCYGIDILTNAASNLCAFTTSRNKFRECTPDLAGNQPKGINLAGGGTIKTWTLDRNEFIDERASPLMFYGFYLAAGTTITSLFLGNQTFKGMAAANGRNAGATITNMVGDACTKGANSISDGGTINYVFDFPGFTPRAITAQTIVAGESAQVTAVGASTFTVAIKKWTAGALTAGTAQAINWVAHF